ncbi:MAG: BspA family leucine-rich repeat surface protein, partial [bacterium]
MNTFIKNNNLLIGKQINLAYDPNKLVLVYDTSKEPANNTVTFPVNGASPNITVDWGDGTSDTYTTTGFKTHTYASPGIYIVQAAGILRAFSFGSGASGTNNKLKLIGCLSFGNVLITSLLDGFRNCSNLIQAPSLLPTTSAITNLGACFNGCTNFNYPINNWNISSVVTLANTFTNASSFNQPLNNWNTSAINNFSSTFANATSFNGNISNWTIRNIGTVNMTSMFNGASSFNQNINSWNTSNVTSMNSMFA